MTPGRSSLSRRTSRSINLARWSAGGRLWRAAAAAGRLRSGVGDAPDRAAGVVGNQQRAILGDGERRRPAPHFGAMQARGPEPGDEVLIEALRLAVLERHAHDLVAGRFGAVPGTLQRDEGI